MSVIIAAFTVIHLCCKTCSVFYNKHLETVRSMDVRYQNSDPGWRTEDTPETKTDSKLLKKWLIVLKHHEVLNPVLKSPAGHFLSLLLLCRQYEDIL